MQDTNPKIFPEAKENFGSILYSRKLNEREEIISYLENFLWFWPLSLWLVPVPVPVNQLPWLLDGEDWLDEAFAYSYEI